MSPTLDRDEIAVRLACALIARDGYDDEGAPRDAVTLADALLRALTPTPAPVAPPAPTPAPEVCCASPLCPHPPAPEAPVHARIGDTVRVTRLKGREWTYEVASVTPQGFAVNKAFSENSREEPQYGEYVGDYEIVTKGPLWPATPAPVPPPAMAGDGAASIARRAIESVVGATPAPEAKRPTHVRVTKIADTGSDVAVGSVYEVVRWYNDGGGAVSPQVMADNGELVELAYVDHSDADYCPSWEPAPCPPPVAGRGEDDVRSAAQALIDEVERMFAAPYAEGVLFHREFKALKAALSRPVRP